MLHDRNSGGRRTSAAFRHHGAPFAKRLSAHSSCVNALAWSGDGRWLASAGDDKHIALCDFHPQDELSMPLVCSGPRGHILCLAFSASDSYMFSGGVDQQVLQFDFSRMSSGSAAGAITRRYSQHSGSIRAISPHPQADGILLTGSEDGKVIQHDVRAPPHESLGSLSFYAEVTGVQFHPTRDHVFVTSDGTGNCHLRDTRTAFGGCNSSLPLLKYVTRLAEPGSLRMSHPEVSSVVFDRTGTRLAATVLNYLPIIYNVWDEWPVATCSAKATPLSTADHAPSYVNACTIKHGSFGNPDLDPHGDVFYGAGSDDFRGYVWPIPDVHELTSRRAELSCEQWAAESADGSIGFARCTTGQRVLPVELQTPQFMLYGHKSIVNELLFHPLEPYIVTAGVERHVWVHSPFPATAAFGALARTEAKVRRPAERNSTPYSYDDLSFNAHMDADDDDDDERMIARFDKILREEGTADVWVTRPHWSGDDSDEGSQADSDADAESDGDEDQDCTQSQD